MRIKLDENLSERLKPLIAEQGHDVTTVAEEGLAGAKDPVVCAAANRESRLLVTVDRDFGDLRKFPPGRHHGIVLFRPRNRGYQVVNPLVLQFVREVNLSELDGCLVVVDRDRVRVRRPPR